MDLPKTVSGVSEMIKGLKELYPGKEGFGPQVLRVMKDQIGYIRATPEERAALQEEFDNKLSDLLLQEIENLPDKAKRARLGMNEADKESMQRIATIFFSYDIPRLPFFSPERRATLAVKAEQAIWRKGLISPGFTNPERDY
jgi:hypothetical protein